MTGRVAIAVALGLAGCGDAPALRLVLREGSGVPAREALTRLEGALERCSSPGEQTFALDPRAPPSEPVRLELEEGERFAIWVRGHESCSEPCVDPERARPGDCVCIREGAGERRAAEACSAWAPFTPGIRLNLRLGPVDGSCPAPRPGC